MLHYDWFTLIMFISMSMSFPDMMQGDNGNIKEVLGIASFTDYLAICMIYHCVVVFCHYSKSVLYNTLLMQALLVLPVQ